MKKVLHITGTRPNYPKAHPVISALKTVKNVTLDTGQHYDRILSSEIRSSLFMKDPDIQMRLSKDLDVYERMSEIMLGISKNLREQSPDLVVVYGDVDSTMIASLVASRMDIPIAHVESGLRSHDDSMPEEKNRKIVDRLSSLHFATELSAVENLNKEGFHDSVFFVGNPMIDSLSRIVKGNLFLNSKVNNHQRILLTCHRQSNVDDEQSVAELLQMCESIDEEITWPIHPRTINNIKKFNLLDKFQSLRNLKIIDPLNYVDFVKCMSTSLAVITDSGGIQEETTYLKIPCFTIRTTTERPCTLYPGSNILVPSKNIKDIFRERVYNQKDKYDIPELWDGNSASRISQQIVKFL